MSNVATNRSGSATTSDTEGRDATSETLKLIEQARLALNKARTKADETTQLLTDINATSTVFTTVAERLMNATFKASGEATRGASPQAVLVSFVEDLAAIARMALGGANDIRRRFRDRKVDVLPAANTFAHAETALDELAAQLKKAPLRPARSPNAAPIEIENRTTATRVPPPLPAAAAAKAFLLPPPKSGGYKN